MLYRRLTQQREAAAREAAKQRVAEAIRLFEHTQMTAQQCAEKAGIRDRFENQAFMDAIYRRNRMY